MWCKASEIFDRSLSKGKSWPMHSVLTKPFPSLSHKGALERRLAKQEQVFGNCTQSHDQLWIQNQLASYTYWLRSLKPSPWWYWVAVLGTQLPSHWCYWWSKCQNGWRYIRLGAPDWQQQRALWSGSNIYKISNYLDLYVLASTPKRRHFQIHGQFDECCFHGYKAENYATAIKPIIDGLGWAFDVIVMPKETRHKVHFSVLK